MADSTRPSRDRASTERRIVEAGERLILAEGVTGLNIQTLAQAAGCDRKLIYRYFGDVDGVIDRVSGRAHAVLVRALDAAPAADANADARAFVRASLGAWLSALRGSPLTLALMAWTLARPTDLGRRIEQRRAALLQAWMRERRPRLRAAPSGDVAALTALLAAAVDQLALAGRAGLPVAGLPLDDAAWPRLDAALDRMIDSLPVS